MMRSQPALMTKASPLPNVMFRAVLLVGGAIALTATLMPTAAQAASLSGTYILGDHPDGNAAPPLYGLRLDGLLTGNANHTYTFSFNPSSDPNPADMLNVGVELVYDAIAQTINISGTVFGGRDNGGGYASGQSGLWDLDFTYRNVQEGSDRLTANTGNGTIRSLDFAVTRGDFNLVAYSGSNSNAFVFERGHRGFTGLSGFGWLNHAPTDGGLGGSSNHHLVASDWLFTADPRLSPGQPVPEPMTILGTGVALGLGTLFQRQRSKRKKANV